MMRSLLFHSVDFCLQKCNVSVTDAAERDKLKKSEIDPEKVWYSPPLGSFLRVSLCFFQGS